MEKSLHEEPIGCTIRCKCGGTVFQLCEDQAFYWLTEQLTIIFRGICDSCGETIQVERDIKSLLLICPHDGEVRHWWRIPVISVERRFSRTLSNGSTSVKNVGKRCLSSLSVRCGSISIDRGWKNESISPLCDSVTHSPLDFDSLLLGVALRIASTPLLTYN